MDELEKLSARVEKGFNVCKENFRKIMERDRQISEALEDLYARVAVLELNADGTIPQDE